MRLHSHSHRDGLVTISPASFSQALFVSISTRRPWLKLLRDPTALKGRGDVFCVPGRYDYDNHSFYPAGHSSDWGRFLPTRLNNKKIRWWLSGPEKIMTYHTNDVVEKRDLTLIYRLSPQRDWTKHCFLAPEQLPQKIAAPRYKVYHAFSKDTAEPV